MSNEKRQIEPAEATNLFCNCPTMVYVLCLYVLSLVWFVMALVIGVNSRFTYINVGQALFDFRGSAQRFDHFALTAAIYKSLFV